MYIYIWILYLVLFGYTVLYYFNFFHICSQMFCQCSPTLSAEDCFGVAGGCRRGRGAADAPPRRGPGHGGGGGAAGAAAAEWRRHLRSVPGSLGTLVLGMCWVKGLIKTGKWLPTKKILTIWDLRKFWGFKSKNVKKYPGKTWRMGGIFCWNWSFHVLPEEVLCESWRSINMHKIHCCKQ